MWHRYRDFEGFAAELAQIMREEAPARLPVRDSLDFPGHAFGHCFDPVSTLLYIAISYRFLAFVDWFPVVLIFGRIYVAAAGGCAVSGEKAAQKLHFCGRGAQSFFFKRHFSTLIYDHPL